MKIIPAIDIINGNCVRLTQGDYNKVKIYSSNPLDVAKNFEDKGIKYLHLVDLEGAKANAVVNYKTLETIAKNTNLIIDFGGGIKSKESIQKAFDYGASKVSIGSIAVTSPKMFASWIATYGAEKIILNADCKDKFIATHGWKNKSNLDIISFIDAYQKIGIQEVVCTDISKDGILSGPSLTLYKEILNQTSIKLIASGGVASIQDVNDLKLIGCDGVIIGKAIYENKISLKEIENFNLKYA